MSALTEFTGIYLENGLEPGKLRMASTGMGWKGEREDKPTTISAADLRYMQWIRVGRGFQLRVGLKGEKRRVAFEGFQREDHERLKNSASNYYNLTLEEVETSVRGWNWGTADVQADDLAFLVAGKPAFHVPLRTVHNTSINKQEVALEFRDEKLLGEIKKLEDDQSKEARRLRRGAPDELVEVRFYIPGTVGTQRRREKAAKKEANGDKVKKEGEDGDVKMKNADEDEDDDDESLQGSDAEGEDKEAAENFFETIKEKAEIGQVQGDTLVSFPEVLCTTPRGRFDVDMFSDFLRLRGKTYDYKILYSSIVKLFLLPKVDDIHVQFIINLEPPIRQGQTRYPYLIMQFAKEEEMDAEIQLSEEELAERYSGKLEKKYEAPAFEVVSTIFKGLSGKKVTTPGTFQSHGGHSAVKANYGANEGYIFFLEKSLLFISRNPLFVAYSDISEVRFERVSGALTSSARTFDLVISTRSAKNDHTFSAVSKEEQSVMEDYLKREKKLRVKNVLEENVNAVNSAIVEAMLEDESDDDDDDGDRPRRGAGGGGGGDEDEDSEVDEDFKAGSDDDDDVEEEYNENYSGSSSSGSDDDDDDSDDDAEESEASEASAKPAKKAKAPAASSKSKGNDADMPAKKKQKKKASD